MSLKLLSHMSTICEVMPYFQESVEADAPKHCGIAEELRHPRSSIYPMEYMFPCRALLLLLQHISGPA